MPGNERYGRYGAAMRTVPPRRRPRRVRLTRRGRLVVTVAVALVVAGVAALTVALTRPEAEPARPARSLTIPEGWRATQVYAAVDEALGLPRGTTRRAVPRAHLPLPAQARGNPEGYLYPATYPVSERATPEALLATMVRTARQRFGDDVAAGARTNAIDVYQAVTIASVVQAEVATPADMGKVARIVYNRLARGMPLQMDSTINYALNRSTVRTTAQDTRLDSPYNTYRHMGLPPTPIGNPGKAAVRAAIEPTPGDWLYFVTVKPGDTRFSVSYEEQMANVSRFHDHQRQAARAAG